MYKVRNRFARTVFLGLLGASLFMTGCSVVKSESDVIGEYELKGANGKIVLTVSPDRTFSESIYWRDGKVVSRSGKWVWSQNGLGFDQLWIPSEFAPEYIREADVRAQTNGQPKYTEPQYWWGRAERHWGTVTWPVFPDADVEFRMVKRFKQKP
jgi:hypothetical protein